MIKPTPNPPKQPAEHKPSTMFGAMTNIVLGLCSAGCLGGLGVGLIIVAPLG